MITIQIKTVFRSAALIGGETFIRGNTVHAQSQQNKH